MLGNGCRLHLVTRVGANAVPRTWGMYDLRSGMHSLRSGIYGFRSGIYVLRSGIYGLRSGIYGRRQEIRGVGTSGSSSRYRGCRASRHRMYLSRSVTRRTTVMYHRKGSSFLNQ